MATKFEVWDSEYHDTDTSEVVFVADTHREAQSFIDGAIAYGTKERDAFTISKANE